MRVLRPTLTFGILLSVCLLSVGCGAAPNVSGDWQADVVAHNREGDIVKVRLMLTNASDSAASVPSTSKSNYRIIDDMGKEYEPFEVRRSGPSFFPSKINPGFSVIAEAEFTVPRSASGLSLEFREGGLIPSSFVTLDLPY